MESFQFIIAIIVGLLILLVSLGYFTHPPKETIAPSNKSISNVFKNA